MKRQVIARWTLSLDWPRFPEINDEVNLRPSDRFGSILVLKNQGLARLYLPQFLKMPKLTSAEWVELEMILDAKISPRHRNFIYRAIKHFIAYHCLNQRMPAWSKIQERLEQIKKTGEHLLELCSGKPQDIISANNSLQSEHMLSVAQIVNFYLTGALPFSPGKRNVVNSLKQVDAIIEACDRALPRVRKRTRRGRRPDLARNYLVRTIVVVACISKRTSKFVLPSPKTKEINVSKYPLLRFVRRTCEIGAVKGLTAISSNSHITDEQKGLATHALNALKDPQQHRSIPDIVRKALSRANRVGKRRGLE